MQVSNILFKAKTDSYLVKLLSVYELITILTITAYADTESKLKRNNQWPFQTNALCILKSLGRSF